MVKGHRKSSARSAAPVLSEDDFQKDIQEKKEKDNKAKIEEEITESEEKVETPLEDKIQKEIRASKLPKTKSNAEISASVKSLAEELGCSIATDVLSSDVSDWYPLDCPPVDVVLGGGIPSGKIIEIFGWESSGKTTFTLEFSKAFSRYWTAKGDDNYAVLWIESESALDKVRAKYMGCDLSRFLIKEAETVDDGFKIIKDTLERAIAKKMHLFIVWDTIAAVNTQAERDDAGGMNLKARMIRKQLKDISTPLGTTNSTLIFVNQLYVNTSGYGEKYVVPGGKGIAFHASVRILMTAGKAVEETLANGTKITRGIEAEFYTKKNKLTLPKQTVSVVINGESGLDRMETLMRFHILQKNVVLKGGWKYITFEGEEYRFQNASSFQNLIEYKVPKLKTYLEYLCYSYYASVSALSKVKLLEKLWEFETTLFGERKTKITEEEFELASLQGKVLIQEQDRE